MNLQTSYSENASRKKWKERLSFPLFSFVMKKHWSLTLMCLIVMFLACPIVSLLSIGSYRENFPDSSFTEKIKSFLINFYSISNPMWAIFILFAAIFVGCVVTHYMQNKKSACFYAGLPISKTKLLGFHYICGVLQYVFSALFAVITLSIVLFITGLEGIYPAVIIPFLQLCTIGFLFYLILFSITVFSGVISGRSSSQFLLTLWILFIIPSVTIISAYFISNFIDGLYFEQYISFENLARFSPVLNLFSVCAGESIGLMDVVTLLFSSAVFTVLAFLFNKIRRTERVEMTLAFKWAEPIIKYSIMFLSALTLGSLFHEIASPSGVWMFFGFAVGALLAMMLMNVILQKNVKAMFSGLRGLAVFSGCFLLIVTVIIFDFFGLEKRGEDITKMDEIVIKYDDIELKLKDHDQIVRVNQLFKDRFDSPASGTGVDVISKSGILYFHSIKFLDETELYRFINTLDNAEEIFFGDTESSIQSAMMRDGFSDYTVDWDKVPELFSIYREEFLNSDFENREEPVLWLQLFLTKGRYRTFPIYKNFTETLDFIKKEIRSLAVVTDPYYIRAEVYADMEDKEYITSVAVTDADLIEKLLENAVPASDVKYSGSRYFLHVYRLQVPKGLLKNAVLTPYNGDMNSYIDEEGNVYLVDVGYFSLPELPDEFVQNKDGSLSLKQESTN